MPSRGYTYLMTTETRFHAHIDSLHRDGVGGLYETRYIVRPSEGENRDGFLDFLDYVYVFDGGKEDEGLYEDGRYGWESHEPTEEGYRSVWVTYCTDAHCTDEAEARDHSAEVAGY